MRRMRGREMGVPMIRFKGAILVAAMALVWGATPQIAVSQGKGAGKGQGGGQSQGKGQGGGQSQGKGQEKAKPSPQGRGEKRVAEPPGRSARAPSPRASSSVVAKNNAGSNQGNGRGGRSSYARALSPSGMPASVRRFAASGRSQDVIAAAAVSHAFARGHGDDVRIEQAGNGMRIRNRKGEPLVYLDDESARNLGRWNVGVVDDNVRQGAPSFCRSGAGHPVWGREWCIDKGFGLGSYQDYRWGRTTDIGNIIFAPSGYRSSLLGSVLANVLGTSTFNRLALHAITLGLLDPLVGRWVSQPTGPQLLMVNSGAYPVAEFVDLNRDNRADDMLVALRPW